MPEIPVSTLLNFFLYLSIPFACAAGAKYFKVPAVIGYMIGGIVIGNLFGDFFSKEVINQFAFFGIVLLLFTVGLEVNFQRMLAWKRFIVIGGLIQMGLSILAVSVLSLFFGFNLLQAFLVGIALSSSSTALVAKMIQDKGEEGSFLGEIVLGMLMFQDLAFIPFIIIFNSITSNDHSAFAIAQKVAIDVAIAAVILWVMVWSGRKFIPTLFDQVAKLSRELLNFFVIIFIFLVALLSSVFKIPILVGVFVAGVLVSQTKEHHHIFTRIRPFRDMLAIIFFIYIGSNVTLSQVVPALPGILLFSLLVIVAKFLIILLTFLALKFSTKLAFYTSAALFQIDEDAFILMSLAFANSVFTEDQYLFIVSATLIGLFLTPLFMSNKEKMYLAVRDFLRKYLPAVEKFIKTHIDFTISPIDAMNIKDHVILCGYGRIGETVGKALTLAQIPFVAVDYNFHTVEKAKKHDVNIIYADPTDIDVLDFLECENAVALITAVPSKFDQEAILINAKKLNPDIFIISRVQSSGDHQRLRDLGAQTIVQPELEASISIIKRVFLLKKMPHEEIIKSLRHLKLLHGVI